MSTRFNLVSAMNEMDRLSGDQNGRDARSVPLNGLATWELSGRSHN
jgi:hypothetical protein